MHLYEVIRWGNASDDALSGGSSGPDTCFLVRAPSIDVAAALVDRELDIMRKESNTENAKMIGWSAAAIYLLGTDAGAATDSYEAMILRGPYIQNAYRHGWRHWYREEAAWVEGLD